MDCHLDCGGDLGPANQPPLAGPAHACIKNELIIGTSPRGSEMPNFANVAMRDFGQAL
jgi:hypothetical protein